MLYIVVGWGRMGGGGRMPPYACISRLHLVLQLHHTLSLVVVGARPHNPRPRSHPPMVVCSDGGMVLLHYYSSTTIVV